MKPQRPGGPEELDEADERPRRTSERAQLRAALALEEAGELREAARMFEYVGEHAQAASLRLEHADTLRDEQQRLAVLREGCARNPGNTEQGRALHRALGDALMRVAEGVEAGSRRRALCLEAAQAYEEGGRHTDAGRLYQALGLLSRAARSFTKGGDIERLEAIHEILEEREQQQRELRQLELEVESAISIGRRQTARSLLLEHMREVQRRGEAASPPTFAQALHELERRMIRQRGLSMVIRVGEDTHHLRVIGRSRLRIGRSPHCEISLAAPAVSREHAELGSSFDDVGEPLLIVRDLGSRAGSFVDGQALVPGEDWPLGPAGAFELGIGIATSFTIELPRVLEGSEAAEGPDALPVALLRELGLGPDIAPRTPATAWTLFAPFGGPLWVSPSLRLPLALAFDDWVSLHAAADWTVTLDGTPVGPGEPVELMVHDRVSFAPLSGEGPRIDVEIEELGP